MEYVGDDMEIGFNVNYLLDALGAIETEEVSMAFVDANSSCLLRQPGNDDCTYVVMPMRHVAGSRHGSQPLSLSLFRADGFSLS